MARRVGGGTRRATFEKQFEFFRKETASREDAEVRSPRGRARRAQESHLTGKIRGGGRK